ncbi:aminotransferase class I/II-fold pyridoxal phosphate-dependent enzyme [bacterium]|nr:aminotransferase class I/II-fold pyridoxal phosphate-dependent enzyme [bacterium]
MKPKIWLSSPHMGGREQDYVAEAFATNWIAPLGPHVNEFERRLAEYNGVGHAAALSSGTAALHLGLILLDVGPGDAVIVQSMTFSASANPVAYLGATPVFVDSEPGTWNMDPEQLERAIVESRARGLNVKAIIPVHLYGMPAQMDRIGTLAEQYGLPLLEDAAEALGSTFDGQKCGSFGRLGVLSFNGNKIITTSGGGALIGNEAALIEKSRFLSTQARDAAPHYQHSHIGYNYRMSNVLAGIGLGQMEVLDDRIAARRAHYARYVALFRSFEALGYVFEYQEEDTRSFSNRWLSCVAFDPARNGGKSREGLRLALETENIEARPLWKPMHLQPIFTSAPMYANGVSERLFDQGLCLPSGSNLTESDWERIEAALRAYFD